MGEKVIPKFTSQQNKNTTRTYSFSPIVNVTVQGNGDVDTIKKAVTKALEESARQYNRRGYELIPGMG